jgi:hypothetical protein
MPDIRPPHTNTIPLFITAIYVHICIRVSALILPNLRFLGNMFRTPGPSTLLTLSFGPYILTFVAAPGINA